MNIDMCRYNICIHIYIYRYRYIYIYIHMYISWETAADTRTTARSRSPGKGLGSWKATSGRHRLRTRMKPPGGRGQRSGHVDRMESRQHAADQVHAP